MSVSAAVGPMVALTRLVASVANPIGELWTLTISSQMVNESDVRSFPLPVTRAIAPRFGQGTLCPIVERRHSESMENPGDEIC